MSTTALTDAEEQAITMTPQGYRHAMLLAALTKYALQSLQMSDRQRLDFLERLNSLVGDGFSQEMLVTIEPMCPTQLEMVHQARSLDRDGDKLGQQSFEILTSGRVFRHFIALNPSILDAIRIREVAAAAPVTVGFQPAAEAHP